MSAVLDFPAIADAPAAVAMPSIKDNVLAQFRATELQLRALAEKYRAVAFDVSTPKGLAAAKEARNELREQGRYAVQRAEAKIKGEVNDLKKAMSDEASRLVAIIAPVEDHVDGQIKAREAQLAAEKAERDRLEAERKQRHENALATIRAYVGRADGLPAARILIGIEALRAMAFGEDWHEYREQAEAVRAEVLVLLQKMHASAVQREEDAARLEAQRVENERVAAEQRAEAARLAAQAAELKRQADELATQRAESERLERLAQENRARQEREIEEARQRAEAASRSADLGTAETPAPGQREAAQNTTSGAAPQQASDHSEPEAVAAPGGHQATVTMIEPEPTMKLGDISKRLGFAITEAFMAQLGITSCGMDKRAVLFKASQWADICQALIKHIKHVEAA